MNAMLLVNSIKIKLVLILMTCTFSMGQFVFAQEPIYNWGEPSTNDNTERRIDQLLSFGDKGFVLLRKHCAATGVCTYWIESYGTDLKIKGINEVPFNVGVMGNSYDIEDVQVNNGTIYAFISHWEKDAGKNSLSVKELHESGVMTHIANLDVVIAETMGNRGCYEIAFSDDGSKILVFAELPFLKKTNEKVRLRCFDVAGMKELWSVEEELPYPSARGLNNEVVIDNKGRAYLFKKIWQKPAWQYELYTSNGSGKFERYTDMKLQGKEILDYKLKFDNNNEFLLYATYSINPSAFEKQPHGSLFIKFDADQNLKSLKVEPWDSEILISISGKNAAENPERAFLSNYGIKDILFRQDGDVLVLMEQMKEKKDVIVGSQPIQYTYTYDYGDFLVFCLDRNSGAMKWWQTFKKNQEVKINNDIDPYGSFVYYLKEDRLYILWNNTPLSVPSIPPANWTEPDGTKYVKHKAFNDKTMYPTFMRVIEPDGSLAYANRKFGLPLFNLHASAIFEMSMNSNFFFDMSGHLVIMATMHNGGKRYRFGFVNL